jgi:hypothetical protein
VTHIAEAYFYLKPFEVSDEFLQSLGHDVSAIAANAAWGLFEPASEIEVHLERGSLKGTASVIGAALAITLGSYHAVAEYRDFKEGVREMVADARTYGGRVIEGVLQEKQVPARSVRRTERRTKTPGRLLRLLNRREWLAAHKTLLSPADIRRESAVIEAHTTQVLEDLPPDQQKFLRDLLGGLDAATDDVAEGLEPSQHSSRVGPPGVGNFQPDLLDPIGHPVAYFYKSFPSTNVRAADGEDREGDFYARFKLDEWHAQRPDHLPPPPHDRPSSSPTALSPPKRDDG